MVENPGGTLVEPLVEPWWNLSSGSPRTTPEPIWAETPKLSAVGEKVGTLDLTALLKDLVTTGCFFLQGA